MPSLPPSCSPPLPMGLPVPTLAVPPAPAPGPALSPDGGRRLVEQAVVADVLSGMEPEALVRVDVPLSGGGLRQ
ncbi:hypothetical protein GCM10018793_68140 [Streptomyces sulfonofaciens]|uniref:Uncharacterized protein n=1 Tax=Streptomyces sulfonofaciens TaxID=68272 RepID=A0A919L863_9ACTN|nr:hypothetical protein [Streptomyces sulfonofaciens]GHH88450.1 hypothetical protein GCM10018793_68140 [Streptomyces sulfonofaciens]